MNALNNARVARDTHKPNRETYERIKDSLVRLMRRAPLTYTGAIFDLRARLDEAIQLRSNLMLYEIDKEILKLNASF